MQIDVERQRVLAQAIHDVDRERTNKHNILYFLNAKGIDLGKSIEVTFKGRINLLDRPGPEMTYNETNSFREDVVKKFVNTARDHAEEYVKLITSRANELIEVLEVDELKDFKFSKIPQSERYKIIPIAVDYRKSICDIYYVVFYK